MRKATHQRFSELGELGEVLDRTGSRSGVPLPEKRRDHLGEEPGLPVRGVLENPKVPCPDAIRREAGCELGDQDCLFVEAVDACHGTTGDEAEALELLDAWHIETAGIGQLGKREACARQPRTGQPRRRAGGGPSRWSGSVLLSFVARFAS